MTSLVHRPRQSQWPAISMDEAYQILLKSAEGVAVEEKKFKDLQIGDVIAEDITALWPHPRFRTSRMDGYAVKSSDSTGQFQVLGGIIAGQSARSLKIPPKHCFRINTGGIVPDDADSVVPVEYTKLISHNESEELTIEISLETKPGQNIREVGSDIKQHEVLIDKSTVLTAPEIALLAANNYSKIKIFRRPIVAVISTGDELVDINDIAELKEGQIIDSNRPMLIELIRSQGFDCVDGGIVRDERELLVEHIKKIAEKSDVLVFSGGVSMGDKDLLKPILLQDLDFDIKFGRVFMKPGLPNTFASGTLHNRPKFVFGLPGNPVSAYVSSHLFLFPFLRRKSGQISAEFAPKISVFLGCDIKLDRRPEYVRAVMRVEEGECWAEVLTTNQVSSRLLSVAKANLLLELPAFSEQRQQFRRGEKVKALVIGPMNVH
ncbi:unnamed protein product [Bursaphelenchus xylophilus]|uniref:(pine wood nematode) hypothetical protein n=1 Tax=Bursaphelenchus xylophilus TaxID=6326 RepID=A0A1I7RTF5_BURXY|nr:unnamed protein product [Bursaphelenchus xylophilus]CAG9122473.1 unnamed protein product [Bursaphelenchus xylophilus]